MQGLTVLVVQVAYVPQSAFIYNASVRDNILFGLPFQQERYDQAIAAAAVRPDLDNMAGMYIMCLVRQRSPPFEYVFAQVFSHSASCYQGQNPGTYGHGVLRQGPSPSTVCLQAAFTYDARL